ncbi:hypothetical protein N9V90_02830, partial [Endozoicomonas sp.]|nr:hypothetical protein [Endozoicomonas sp.]
MARQHWSDLKDRVLGSRTYYPNTRTHNMGPETPKKNTLPVIFCRESAPELTSAKLGIIFQNKGSLTRAISTAAGEYLFSEKGAGIKPLVITGKPEEIFAYFSDHTGSIRNIISKELKPHIDMGIETP